jgi:hypothetical protein
MTPVVLIGATPFGKALAETIHHRLCAGDLRLADWLACMDAGGDPPQNIARALTRILHVSHVVRNADGDGRSLECRPQIWVLGAVAELDRAGVPVPDLLAAARRELHRRSLSGQVFGLLYDGPLDECQSVTGGWRDWTTPDPWDALLLVSDTAQCGFLLAPEDVLAAASLQVEIVVRSETLRSRIAMAAARGERRCLALGVAAVDPSRTGLQRCAEELLRQRLASYLASDTRPAPSVEVGTARVSARNLDDCFRGSGASLAAVSERLGAAAEGLAAQVRTSQVKWQAEHTRRAIRSLLPQPPVQRSLWQGLVAWWRGNKFRGPARPVSVTVGSAASREAESLADCELRRLQITRLLVATASRAAAGENGSPWERPLTDHPLARQAVAALLPATERVAWRLTSESVGAVLGTGSTPDVFLRTLERLCHEVLAEIDLTQIYADSVAKHLIAQAAVAATPLYPGAGTASDRLALLPAERPEVWERACREQAFEILSGETDGRVVLVNIATDLPRTAESEAEAIP